MTRHLPLALIQMTSGTDVAANTSWLSQEIRKAADAGARFVLTPETSNMLQQGRKGSLAEGRIQADDLMLREIQILAAELGVWVLLGSLALKIEEERLINRSFLIDASGHITAHYDKIHMFDVDLGEGERYRESALYQPGERAVIADTPWAKLGLTICYDLRFPYLYRRLAKAGAEIITVPSAFTRPTGKAHWHTLLRARAIETGCFILAPAQSGEHACGRKTYGHSLVVSPWGEVIAEAGEAESCLHATIDLDEVVDARRLIPSLRHDRDFDMAL